jgi:folate-binding protein YgfZ
METPLRRLHETAGASLATWFDCLLPDRFTDFDAEYRMARETVALLDTNHRAWLRLTGPDRVRYLNAMVSSDTKALAAGEGVRALLLNPQGHILADLEAFALEESYLLACPLPVRQRTFETLDRYIIMDDATLTDATEEFGAVAMEGPCAAEAVAALTSIDLGELADLAHRAVEVAGVASTLIRTSETGPLGARIVSPRAQLATVWQAAEATVRKLGGGPAGWQALNALRLEAGVPWYGYDFDDRTIPHEAALETTHINFTKGCYTGQEIVERVRARGRVNRRRAGLAFSAAEPPPPETVLLAEGKEAGKVTSAALSPRLGRAIGMAYLRREFLAAGTQLDWSGGTAEVIELPVDAAASRTTA